MTFKYIAKKVINSINKAKPYVDSIVDPALVFFGANVGMLYGLLKVGESNLSDPTKTFVTIGGTFAGIYLNKKAVAPLAKKIREMDLKEVKAGLEAKLGSWIKTGLFVTAIVTTAPYVADNVKHVIYEAISPKSEKLVYKETDLSKIDLANKETVIGRIQRTERFRPLIEKYEKNTNCLKIVCIQ